MDDTTLTGTAITGTGITSTRSAALDELLTAQHGVVSRRQLLGLGHRPHDVQRLVRRRLLTRLHPGVFVDHTGPPSWRQRAWAAVLALWPAALCGVSALDDGRERLPIQVAVVRGRHLVAPPGVRVHQLRRLDERVLWNHSPPRLRLEDAVLGVAAVAAGEFAAFEALAEACRNRRTTPARLGAALADRPELPRRAWLAAVLADLADGSTSVLERGFLARVERPHGLPRPARQVRAVGSTGVLYRDAEYAEGTVVELDGRLVHNTVRQRDADLDRDLDVAATGRSAVRLSWGQVFDRPCRTAAGIAAVLRRHGWTGQPRPCSPGCPVKAAGSGTDPVRGVQRIRPRQSSVAARAGDAAGVQMVMAVRTWTSAAEPPGPSALTRPAAST